MVCVTQPNHLAVKQQGAAWLFATPTGAGGHGFVFLPFSGGREGG